MKKMNKKGFTLAELLIVIAILAILIAIAIPVFSAQLEKARESVDASVERSAKSIAESHYLLEHAGGSSGISVKFEKDSEDNLVILTCSGGGHTTDGDGKCTVPTAAPSGKTELTSQCTCDTTTTEHAGVKAKLTVTVDGEGRVTGTWAQ